MNNAWIKQTQLNTIKKDKEIKNTHLFDKSKSEDKLYTAKELIYWSSKNNGQELIFDKLLDIHDDITHFLNNNDIKIKTDKELFLMKILLFVYDNS